MSSTTLTTPPVESTSSSSWLDLVNDKTRSMRFGSVQIIVHEGRVTQIEATEKFRPAPPSSLRRPASHP